MKPDLRYVSMGVGLWTVEAALPLAANGLRVGGAPWESYVTDPGEHPDPADWRTEVFWPLVK